MRHSIILLLLAFITGALTAQPLLLVGTYTTGESKGIYTFRFDSKTGKAVPLGEITTANPSYLAVSPGKKFVYAVNELNEAKGSVTSFSLDPVNGRLRALNMQLTHGDDPCYVSVDKTGEWVVAGNYSGGNFSVFPVKKNGQLGAAAATIQHTGHSADTVRQEKAHVHCTVFSPDNKYLLVADLGTDNIYTYAFNEQTGTVTANDSFMVSPGAGPRHIIFHPSKPAIYLAEELSASVSAFGYKDGKLSLLGSVSFLEPSFRGAFSGADIHMSADGKFVYVSNRGEANNIAIFSVNENGTLTNTGYHSSMGIKPRNFTIDPSGHFLLVANQESNEIVVLKRDAVTGSLSDTGERIQVPNPVCLKWVE